MRKFKLLVFIISISGTYLFGQNLSCPFSKGFNLGQWFQRGSALEIRNSRTKTDMENMIALGADHVRLPIDLNYMCGSGPNYTLDPILFLNLDRVVDWAEELGLYIILDNHPVVAEDKNNTDKLAAIWRQMANHFENRSRKILYELRNEPHGISDADWGEMQNELIKAIRTNDKVHTIIVSPSEYGSYGKLADLPEYEDDNLIYTFHFYDPFLFTHQGANWTGPSMESLTGVPYPYDASRMPAMPASFQGTWLEPVYGWYSDDGTKAGCQTKLNIATQFRADRKVPIYCGEFGALQEGSTEEDRLQWTQDIADLFKTGEIAWSMWGYGGGFGIFKEGSKDRFPQDLHRPTVEALGLTMPDAIEIIPESSDYVFYDDLSHPEAFDVGWSGPFPNYYQGNAAQGDYCIRWAGAGQYNAFGWEYTTPKNFSLLMERNYVLKFWIKSSSPNLSMDLRFNDTDLADGEDHPWRMTFKINSSVVAMDGEWHEVEVRLKDMVDSGSWHNNNWYDPQGKFDWSNIDQLQFSTEDNPMGSTEIWIDHMRIVEGGGNTSVDYFGSLTDESIALDQVFPNPFINSTTIRLRLDESLDTNVQIYDLSGKLIRILHSGPLASGTHNLSWDTKNDKGIPVPGGTYICEMKTREKNVQKKMILLR